MMRMEGAREMIVIRNTIVSEVGVLPGVVRSRKLWPRSIPPGLSWAVADAAPSSRTSATATLEMAQQARFLVAATSAVLKVLLEALQFAFQLVEVVVHRRVDAHGRPGLL